MEAGVEVRAAKAGDLEAVKGLLAASALPVDGLEAHFEDFFVAVSSSRIVGAVGIELHGRDALLRSLVVEAEGRGKGLGDALTRVALGHARSRGARTVSLLTTTADRFFAARRFNRVPWEALPGALGASTELRGACPKSAVAMTLPLDPLA